ncbi:hypothetical protein J3L18_29700 [Mucilaginibacter gossypii]|uniref:hypothetical protein n=1 Tax=Mucilaginibacter gossypii TaxID=551996 RepID=UPI000DCEED14|nr:MULTISPECIES: hypothetical protein [Mucilaginibacter]QTE37233.1 hypothetical protein J3L18_29700 [Mucilaginibacter gossypii]RAV57194.1 hypothetical protein DIU36_12780 [Mucilaginibacter rubeus]
MANYVNSQELEWKHAQIAVLGVVIRGLRGFKYKKSTDSEHLFAAGDEAVGIQSGNKKCDGSIKLLKSEIDKLNQAARDAGYDDFADVPYQLIVITVNYKVAFGRKQETDIISGVKFTEWEKAMEQGAKMMEVDVPFLALSVKSL